MYLHGQTTTQQSPIARLALCAPLFLGLLRPNPELPTSTLNPGCFTNLCRTTPAAAITFTSFELISRALKKFAIAPCLPTGGGP